MQTNITITRIDPYKYLFRANMDSFYMFENFHPRRWGGRQCLFPNRKEHVTQFGKYCYTHLYLYVKHTYNFIIIYYKEDYYCRTGKIY